ncbi:MAG TPA: transcriptional regulator [Candidatus Limnocylindria bacterium]|nr:transcriptional regulator [Candidatus Limnocylindria bacterium]
MADPAGKANQVAAVALLGEPTRRALYDAVADAPGGLGRDAAAALVEISRDLAAFHLDRLVDVGLLTVTHRRLSGRTGPGAGRPAKVYERPGADFSVSLPARRYDLLAETLAEGVEDLAADLGESRVTAALDERAREHGRAAGVRVRQSAGGRAGTKRRAAELVNVLAAFGFEPRVSEDGTRIILGNCPYQAVAGQHRALTCGMNLAWAEGALERVGETGLAPVLDIEPGRCCIVFTKE